MSAAAQIQVNPAEVPAELVEQLIAIWSRILQTEEVFPESDFFELGGNSLLAVNMFLEIERATGRHLPITSIYDAPTVAELAVLIESEAPAAFSPLVLLREGGRGAPLFIVHGVGGTVIELTTLGKLIDSDGPVYAIQARGLDGSEPPLDRIEDMADYYVDWVRRVAPDGPYRLAGYSFGGVVAIEMARRLGPRRVEKLILLDAFAHPKTWPFRSRAQVSVRKFAKRLHDRLNRPLGETVEALLRKLGSLAHRRGGEAQKADRAVQLTSWLGTINPNLPPALREARLAGDRALLAFVPKYYPGRIVFLKADRTDDVFPARARRVWHRLVLKIELHRIPGSHRSIVTDDAATTAEWISRSLAPPAPRPALEDPFAPVLGESDPAVPAGAR